MKQAVANIQTKLTNAKFLFLFIKKRMGILDNIGNNLDENFENHAYFKVCNKCKIKKTREEFNYLWWHRPKASCKECNGKILDLKKEKKQKLQKQLMKNLQRKYYLKSKELRKEKYETQKTEILSRKKEYVLKNIDKVKQQHKKSVDKNKKRILKKKKVYYNKHAQEIKEYQKQYRKENPNKVKDNNAAYKQIKNIKRNARKKIDTLFKLECVIRSLIFSSFKAKDYKKNSKTFKILGCSAKEFKSYIENKFESWMNWNNHGKYVPGGEITWQLDHIIPVSSATTSEELIKLNHYTNFQPLESLTNIIKSNKMST